MITQPNHKLNARILAQAAKDHLVSGENRIHMQLRYAERMGMGNAAALVENHDPAIADFIRSKMEEING